MERYFYFKCKCGNVIQTLDQDGTNALCGVCKEYFTLITDEAEIKEAEKEFGIE